MPWITTPDESAELLELAQEAGRTGVLEWQLSTGVVKASPQLLLLYGIADFDDRYETLNGVVFREDVARITFSLEAAYTTRMREVQIEFRINRADSKELRWIESRNLIFYDDAGSPTRLVAVNADVTERKRALVELRRFTETLEEKVKERTRELELENAARQAAEEALRQAQKMEAVGQLTGGIAHDFNNLLTVVLGGLERIGRQLPSLEGSSPAVGKISQARDMALQGVQRAALLTSRLLAFSRRQALDPKPTDVNRLVANISELLHRTLGETVSLETVLAGGLWRAFIDAGQLENAIVNLAVNARDAMPSGGRLTIETANSYLDDAYVSSLAEPVNPGQYVLISVSDTGEGMNADTMERAFEPFFTTKEVGKGTGLGLSQVYGFLRQSAGHVRIYSEVGQGTSVKIYLPRHAEVDDRITEPKEPNGKNPSAGLGERILLVEDDEQLRRYTSDTLVELGYVVLEAANGQQALEVLDREPQIDLLFTDVVMPGGMSGRDLAEMVARRRPGTRVLYTTGYSRNAIVHGGRLDAGVKLIGKPFTVTQLATKIREALDDAK